MNVQFIRIWEDAAVAYVKVLSQNCSGGPEENQ
jgi:hypothetical protein